MVEFLPSDGEISTTGWQMFQRFINYPLQEALAHMPVVLLRGARQTGKTTLVKALMDNNDGRHYLSFDHLPSLALAREDPVSFISRLQKPVILDEIQRVPELFLPIKADVDNNRIPGRYLLTGSADPLLTPQMGDSLAGRMRLLNLWPLSQGEIAGKKETFLDRIFSDSAVLTGSEVPCSKPALLTAAARGGFPAPVAMQSERQRHLWFNDYVSLVLQKDILDLSRIENLSQIPNLLSLIAARAGGLLNSQELSRTAKLSSTTLHRYMELLRTLFMIFFVPAWSGNLTKRLVKSPKAYLTDSSLLLYLLNMDSDALLSDPYLFGNVIENFVVTELLKQISWHDKSVYMYHYRDYGQTEVDIVLEGPAGRLVGIEVKSSETIGKNDFKGLKSFQEAAGDKFVQGVLLYAGDRYLPFGENLTAVPITSLWL